MEVENVDLDKLMARLIHSCEQTRCSAREEIQSWPFETVLGLLARHWPQGYNLPRPEPATRWEHLRRRLSSTEEPPLLSAVLDLIVIFNAQVATDTRMAGLVLSVMARTQERERQLSAGSSNHWPSSAMNARVYMVLDAPTRSPAHTAKNLLHTALSQLVPAITPENCELSPFQCDALLIPLQRPYRNVDLTLNILILLSWLGENRHIPTIEHTAQSAIGTDNGQRIRAAANACLEQIRARQNKTRQSQTLLRPTIIAAADPPGELLRPTAKEDARR